MVITRPTHMADLWLSGLDESVTKIKWTLRKIAGFRKTDEVQMGPIPFEELVARAISS